MIAPLPPPRDIPPAEPPGRPPLPRVRLDVRSGTARPSTYDVPGDEFLIGGAAGCDLRLSAPNLPPVVAQITRRPDGVRVRRVAPHVPVSLNDVPLAGNTPVAVRHGDRLGVAGAEVAFVLRFTTLVSPAFTPLDPDDDPPPDRDAWAEREAALVERERAVEAEAERLRADRAAWAVRQREIEDEFERLRSAATEFPWKDAPAPDRSRAADLDAREAELGRVRDELAAVKEQLAAQYGQRRDELARTQELIREANSRLQADRRQFEADRDALLAADRDTAERVRLSEARLAEVEPLLADVRRERERLATDRAEFDRHRESAATDRDILDRARETAAAERAAEGERLARREAALVGRETAVAASEARHAAAVDAFAADRRAFADDLIRLDRRQAEADERERGLGARETEVAIRLEQLKRDADELAERLRDAAGERDRVNAEAERVDRRATDLDAQAATLADRAAEVEAQQAALVTLRERIGRAREEADREAAELARARAREDEAHSILRDRLREAEALRAELSTVQENAEQERRRLEERDSLLAAGLEEIRQRAEGLAEAETRLREREEAFAGREAEYAEQSGALKGRLTHAVDLQARLEADRVAIREREAAAAQAEDARQQLQEQLRRRAEELTSRSQSLDDLARELAADRAALADARKAVDDARRDADGELARRHADVDARAAEVEAARAAFAEKEAALARQVGRLREVGQAVAAERKSLAESRATWETDRAALLQADADARVQSDAFRKQVAADLEALRSQAPGLEAQAAAALDRLSAARDMLRGHLTELHDYARESRADLDALRSKLGEEADRLRGREQELDRARDEHRLAVTAFRQQLVEWQGRVGEIRRVVSQSESRLEAKEAAVTAAARQVDATTHQLAAQAEELQREREAVAHRRTEVDRHLTDMREWYRQKLRDLAGSERGVRSAELEDESPSRPRLADTGDPSELDDLEPGDRQLGELLRSRDLVDAQTLNNLWAEARRQRRTLRQVLLASGAITLYQLALIEAGNLDRLVLGRFRVVDRLRVSPREAVYRVFDPAHADGPSGGLFLLRHLSEADAHDAVRPDEFRQRFGAARDAAHPNVLAVVDVVDVNGRPAAVQEWLVGVPASDLPPAVAHPGCWVRLLTMAAAGLDAAHRAGLVHGRLSADAFVLTPDGVLKLTGAADPPWLDGAPADAHPAADLRALGAVAAGWAAHAAVKKRGTKPFPDALLTVVRRLEADPQPPMEDTVSAGRPYASAAELLADLQRLARETGFSDKSWDELLRHAAENAPGGAAGLRQSA